MNAKDQEDLDTWLVEVELAQQKIKELASGVVPLDEFDKREKAIEKKKQADKIKKVEEEAAKRYEAYEKQKQGHSGKGEKNTYISFCKFCHWEYELPTPQCLRCKKNTVNFEERYAELTTKVGEYKVKKTKREERKKKWELWKKTQAMLWKKSSTNYSKWDNYTSESDSEPEDTEPIVPKNDPNFQALEMDLQQRSKKRAADKAIAEGFKTKGNEFMQKEDYKEAVKQYSLGLDAFKDIKALWTNRALAYIKLKKYTKAIEDCTRVLDYCECFEDGYTQSRDSAFKAFIRRSFSKKEKKDYKGAAEDVKEAIKLCPKDKAGLDLKEEIEFIVKHKEEASKLLQNIQATNGASNEQSVEEKANEDKEKLVDAPDDEENEEVKQKQPEKNNNSQVTAGATASSSKGEDGSSAVDDNSSGKSLITDESSEKKVENEKSSKKSPVAAVLESTNGKDTAPAPAQEKKDYNVVYKAVIDDFMKKPAAEVNDQEITELTECISTCQEAKIYFFERKGTARLENLLKERKQCYLLANVLIADNILFQDQFLKNECHLILQDIITKILTVNEHSGTVNYSEVEDALEVLNTLSTLEKSRNKLAGLPQTLNFVKTNWNALLAVFKEEPQVTSNFLVFASNLCYGSASLLKKNLIETLPNILNHLHEILSFEKKKGAIENLRENVYNLLANLLTDDTVRNAFSEDKYTQILEDVIRRMASYDLVAHPKFQSSAEAALAVLVNASFQATPPMQLILKRLSTDLIIVGRFFRLNWRDQKYFEIFSRSLQILAKLDYTDSKLIERLFDLQEMMTKDVKLAGHLIRLYANITTNESCIEQLKKSSKVDFKQLTGSLKQFIQEDDETRFCNSCNLAAYVNEIQPQHIVQYKELIPRLLNICKEKIGNFRKNAAIFLAKLSKDKDNLAVLKELHGIEILHSITAQVVKK